MQHQCGLAHARCAAHQDQGAPHRAAPQHPVQLPHAGGEADLLLRVNVRQGRGLDGVEGAASAGGAVRLCFWRGLLLHNRVPGPAGRTFSGPLGRLVAALCAIKYGFYFCHGVFLRYIDLSPQTERSLKKSVLRVASSYVPPTVYSRCVGLNSPNFAACAGGPPTGWSKPAGFDGSGCSAGRSRRYWTESRTPPEWREFGRSLRGTRRFRRP